MSVKLFSKGGAHAVDGGSHTGGGVALLQLDLHVGVEGLVGLGELLHHGGHGGRTGDDDLAGHLAACPASRRSYAAADKCPRR